MEFKDEKWQNDLEQIHTQQDGVVEERRFSASGRRISITDAVFGDIVEGGPNYRDVCNNTSSSFEIDIDSSSRSAGLERLF